MQTKQFLAVVLTILTFAFIIHAEDTNVLKTRLENFEAVTGRVLVKGTDEIGIVTGKSGIVIVTCKEIRDATTNQREFGLNVTVRQSDETEDSTVVDEDEFESILGGLDYIGKVDWSVSSLSHFEAAYTTKGGLKMASYSSRRTGTIEGAVVSNRLLKCRTGLTMAQLAQLRVLIEQGKAKIDLLRKEK